jgi:hypothetical protein
MNKISEKQLYDLIINKAKQLMTKNIDKSMRGKKHGKKI